METYQNKIYSISQVELNNMHLRNFIKIGLAVSKITETNIVTWDFYILRYKCMYLNISKINFILILFKM